jgi:hypothetical protein
VIHSLLKIIDTLAVDMAKAGNLEQMSTAITIVVGGAVNGTTEL